MSNAVKFTKEGTILVKVEKEDEKEENQQVIVVSVKDTGEGIDTDIMPRLFTRFTTGSYHGTGLGLFISKNIIEAHGGKMWAEDNSNRKDKGATFYFSLQISK